MGSVTISSNSYDIYGTSAAADIYLGAKLGAADWSGASADTKSRALVQGTRLIRTYLAARGHDLDPAEAVDVEVEEANYELAFALVLDPTIASNANSGSNIRRTKAGSAEIEYFRPVEGSRFPVEVQVILNGWLSSQGSSGSAGAFSSGTCEESTLCADDFGLSEGY